MQISKSDNTLVFAWKQYVEDFTLTQLSGFEIRTHEICAKLHKKCKENIIR